MFPKSVPDGKPFQLSNQIFGAAVKILERRVLHLVDAFNLAHQQFGIADQFERFWPMLDCVFERGNQALVLGEVVGLMAEVLAEMRDLASRLILDYHTIPSRTGITSRPAVAVGYEVVLGSIFTGRLFTMRKERLGSSAAGRRHAFEFTTPFPSLRIVIPSEARDLGPCPCDPALSLQTDTRISRFARDDNRSFVHSDLQLCIRIYNRLNVSGRQRGG
jgi:hypothetical protein